MIANPDRQLDRLELRWLRVGVGPSQEQQAINDLPDVTGLPLDQVQDTPVFLGRTLLAKRRST